VEELEEMVDCEGELILTLDNLDIKRKMNKRLIKNLEEVNDII